MSFTEIDPERCLMGAVALDPERVIPLCQRGGITPGSIESPILRVIFETALEMHSAKSAIDPFSIADTAKKNGKNIPLDELTACIDQCPTAAHAEYYIGAVTDKALGRELKAMAFDVMKGVQEGIGSKHVYDELVKRIKKAEQHAYCGNEWVNLEKITEEVEKEWMLCSEERLVKKNLKFINGVPLPWECLNRVYVGLKPGLHILAARPGEGKTATLVNFSEFWDQIGLKHVIVSIDMEASQMFRRFGSSGARTSLPKLDWGARREEIEKTTKKMRDIARRGNLMITEADRVDRIVSAIGEAVHRTGAKIAAIDYLQVVNGQDDARRMMERKEEVARVVREIKACAVRKLKIPIFLLCQMNREYSKDAMKNEERKPTLTDLGDSGEIERAAASVALLHVDKPTQDAWELCPPVDLAYGFDYLASTLRPLWYIVAKQQNGSKKDVPFIMYPNYFMLRPGNYGATKCEVEVEGTKRKVFRNYPFFERVRDDWRILPEDAHLEKRGILGPREFSCKQE
jgi:replicative DNA helicase